MANTKANILVVDDEESIRETMRDALESDGFEVTVARNGTEAFQFIRANEYDLVLTDLKMPTIDGMEILYATQKRNPDTAVIIITGHSSEDAILDAWQAGAFYFLKKPIDLKKMREAIRKALEPKQLKTENIELKRKVEQKFSFENIIAHTRKMQEILDTVMQIAPTRANVLITGESGTGKELIANAIHYNSTRKNRPFIRINCAVLAEGVLESELFGHEKGSFTGAIRRHEGVFERADEGTLFLDEIGDIPLSTQVKLLRVLEDKEFVWVGGTVTKKVDLRIITATNRDLKTAIREEKFREDLYFRLKVVSIDLPPLRERKEDIPFMIHKFIKDFCAENMKPEMVIQQDALESLVHYHWPGNIRELKNVLESLVVRIKGTEIKLLDLPEQIRNIEFPASALISAGATLEEIEKELIRKTLESVQGNRRKTADILNIGLRTLYRKINAYHLDH